ncbi:MAG: RDD family protein [Chitinophagales bacterium]
MQTLSVNYYGSFMRRLVAFLIDRFLIWWTLFFTLMHWGYDDFEMWNYHNLFNKEALFAELLVMLYYVLCETSSWQGTLGKKIMGLKVVTTSFQKLQPKDSILRFLSKYLSSFFALGFIWVIFDDHKQGWHDKIAGTYVIKNDIVPAV